MSQRESKAQPTLEIQIMFEPSRLATVYLTDAYARIVPVRKRAISPHQPPDLEQRDLQRRAQP